MFDKPILTIIGISILVAVTGVPADTRSWSQAGQEIMDAADAVGDATVETSKDAWEATKGGAGKAWDKTKEVSGETWDATKRGASSAWDKTKEVSGEAWDATKKTAQDGDDYLERKTTD